MIAVMPFKLTQERPNYIEPKHWQKWLDSGVAPEIVAANVQSLSGNTVYDYLLYSDSIPRRNDGRVSEWVLKRYAHVERGGWWCSK